MGSAAQRSSAGITTGTWLTLHATSALLGVAPATVRRWADAGRIPTSRTPGGHRRFDPQAVQMLVLAQHRTGPAEPGPLASLDHPLPGRQPWHTHLSQSPAAEQMRGLGQRLLGLLIQYLAWRGDDRRFLADSRAVGAGYGAAAFGAGASLSETVEAFLYFRRSFRRLAVEIQPVAQTQDVGEVVRIAERIELFMDGVLLSTVGGYEQAAAADPPNHRAGPLSR